MLHPIIRMTILLFLTGCGALPSGKRNRSSDTPPATTAPAPTPVASPTTPATEPRVLDPESFINCGNGNDQCAIVRTEIAPANGVDTDYSVTYTSTCFVGKKSNPSTLEVVGSYGNYALDYGASATFTLRSSSGLTLHDRDPAMTDSWFFDYTPTCTLNFAVTAKVVK